MLTIEPAATTSPTDAADLVLEAAITRAIKSIKAGASRESTEWLLIHAGLAAELLLDEGVTECPECGKREATTTGLCETCGAWER